MSHLYFAPPNVSSVRGLADVTLSSAGPTDGGNYGPNTPGTTTAGLQEALNAIKTAGGGRLRVGPGDFTLQAQVTIPANIALEIIGNGNQKAGGGQQTGTRFVGGSSLSATDMIIRGSTQSNAVGLKIRDCYFRQGAATLTNSVLNLALAAEARSSAVLNCVTVDADGGSKPTFSLVMDNGDDSALFSCDIYGSPLSWVSGGGGVKIFHGTLVAGAQISAQEMFLIGTTWTDSLVIVASGAAKKGLQLFNCYANVPSASSPYTSNIVNISGTRVVLGIYGGRYFNKNSATFILSGAAGGTAADAYDVIIHQPKFSVGDATTCQVLDAGVSTHTIQASGGIYLLAGTASAVAMLDLYASTTGLGQPTIQLMDQGHALPASGGGTIDTWADPIANSANNAHPIIRVAATVRVSSFTSGSCSLTVAYIDFGGTARTKTLLFENSLGAQSTFISAADVFHSSSPLIRMKQGTTATFAATGTYTLAGNATFEIEQLG